MALRIAVSMIAIAGIVGCGPRSFRPEVIHVFERVFPKTVTVNGHQLAYTVTGTGPAVILLHGFGGQGWQWEYQQQPLSRHFTVYTLDIIGYGYSDRPRIEYTPDLFADSLRGFMDALGIGEAALIGNSMGAGVAMVASLKYPDRINRMVLIDGFPQGVRDKTSSFMFRQFLRFKPAFLLHIGFYFSGKDLLRSALQEVVLDHRLLTEEVIDRAYRFRTFPGTAHVIFSTRRNLSAWEERYAPRIPEITTPTLIIWGAHDQPFPLSVGEELRQQITNAAFVVIADAGHMPMWEKPDETNAAILAFLRYSFP